MATSDVVTNVDIVAIPAIGADAERAWTGDGFESPWLTTELPRLIPNARVLLYDHGELDADDSLESLGTKLLIWLQEKRKATSRRRPIFFVCHSTGGVVATAALVKSSRSRSPLDSIFASCYGIAFLSTPHYGSSYLSAPEFGRSIRRLLHLRHTIPAELRETLRPRHETLVRLTGQFRAISADMEIWTFMETVDSTFTITDTETGSTIDMHVPITSIRSGLLGFEHESELPLATDHIGTASFKGQETTARMDFIRVLQSSIATALELSIMSDVPLQVEQEVMVHVNGFFEDTARGVSRDSPLQLWSTKTPLEEFMESGPMKCLEERLKKSNRLSSSTYDDSEPSEFGTELTQNQSRAMTIFTVFTVIFLPLSFFTSLFGINAREWSGEETNLTLRTMLTIAGPTSVAVIVSALLIAFSERLRDILLKSQKILFGLCKDILYLPLLGTMQALRHGASSKKTTAKSSVASTTRTKTSRAGDRFGRYLSSWRRGDIEEDFWKRDDELKEKEKDKESGYSSTTTTHTATAAVNIGNSAGRRNAGTTLPSVLVSEASGGRSFGHGQGNGFVERMRVQSNSNGVGVGGGLREAETA